MAGRRCFGLIIGGIVLAYCGQSQAVEDAAWQPLRKDYATEVRAVVAR